MQRRPRKPKRPRIQPGRPKNQPLHAGAIFKKYSYKTPLILKLRDFLLQCLKLRNPHHVTQEKHLKKIILLLIAVALAISGYVILVELGAIRVASHNSKPLASSNPKELDDADNFQASIAREDFDGPEINPEWEWANGKVDYYSLIDKPGWLSMKVYSPVASRDTPVFKNWIKHAVPAGDFTVETRMAVEGSPDLRKAVQGIRFDVSRIVVEANRGCGGITAIADSDHGRFGHVVGHNVHQDRPIIIRLVRAGSRYTMFYKMDSLPWVEIPFETNAGQEAGEVGLAYWVIPEGGDDFDPDRKAYFDYIKVDNIAHIPTLPVYDPVSTHDVLSGEETACTFLCSNGAPDVTYYRPIQSNLPTTNKAAYQYAILAKRDPWKYGLGRQLTKDLEPGRVYRVSLWARGTNIKQPNKPCHLINAIQHGFPNLWIDNYWSQIDLTPHWVKYQAEFRDIYGFHTENKNADMRFEIEPGTLVEIGGIELEGLTREADVKNVALTKVAEIPDPINLVNQPWLGSMFQLGKVPAEFQPK